MIEARQVYWCWIVNEPFVIEFVGNLPKCILCNWVGEGFLIEHTFCCHIDKPKRSQ